MKSIFAKKLKEERLKKNLTQQQLADLINNDDFDIKISRNSITRYENGTRTPDYNTLSAISYVLDVDIDYLLGKSEKKHIESTNEELNDFIKIVTEISEKDDDNTNYLLWCLIHEMRNFINSGYKNNILELLYEIIQYVSMEFNYSINTKNLNRLNDFRDMLINYHKSEFTKYKKDFAKKYIPQIMKFIDTFGLSELNDTDIKILKDYCYDNDSDDIPPNIRNYIFDKDNK